jgi:hypothetical protein
MTLRIEKAANRHKTMICLSGRLQSEHLVELKMQVDREQLPIALDLEGVTLVDIEIVHFLNACEKSRVENKHAMKPYPHMALFNHSSWRELAMVLSRQAVHGYLRLCWGP